MTNGARSPTRRLVVAASLLVAWSVAARAREPAPAPPDPCPEPATDEEDRGEIVRAPGAPPRTPSFRSANR